MARSQVDVSRLLALRFLATLVCFFRPKWAVSWGERPVASPALKKERKIRLEEGTNQSSEPIKRWD